MATLLDDLEMIFPNGGTRSYPYSIENAYARLRAFIEQHQPWYPPRQPGFGPWVEYDGTNGPRVDQEVKVLELAERLERSYCDLSAQKAAYQGWFDASNPIVAYCVKEDQS
jgi:hypothetical protein